MQPCLCWFIVYRQPQFELNILLCLFICNAFNLDTSLWNLATKHKALAMAFWEFSSFLHGYCNLTSRARFPLFQRLFHIQLDTAMAIAGDAIKNPVPQNQVFCSHVLSASILCKRQWKLRSCRIPVEAELYSKWTLMIWCYLCITKYYFMDFGN